MAETVIKCRHCGYSNSAVTSIAGQAFAPEAGAVSICLGCSAIGIFIGNGLQTREPTDEERAALIADPGVQAALALVSKIQRDRVRARTAGLN